MAKTIVFLKRPQITSGFEVTVVYHGLTGAFEGEIEAVRKFLDISEGVPQFDLEFEGYRFLGCVLATDVRSDSVSFSFGSRIAIEEP